MDKKVVIMLYSDFEGTILRESDGNYDDMEMYNFLKQLSKLQELTGAKVKMHIVSPISKNDMSKKLERLDKNFMNFNRLQKDSLAKLNLIEGAAASPSEEFFRKGEADFLHEVYMRRVDSRIVDLKKPTDQNSKNPAAFGKANYVRSWTELMKTTNNVKMVIYCGNGRNDLDAMSYVTRQKGGFVICPKNSRHEAKAMAQCVSEKTDLPGITDGIAKINRMLEQKSDPGKNLTDNNEQR